MSTFQDINNPMLLHALTTQVSSYFMIYATIRLKKMTRDYEEIQTENGFGLNTDNST